MNRAGFSFLSVLIALVLGAFLGAAATWLVLEKEGRLQPSASAPPPASTNGAPAIDEDRISRKLREWNLDSEDLREELDRAGRILREKGREFGARLAEETSDVRIIALIKAKYTLDEQLSARQIAVGCKDGHVTLTGTVASAEQVGRAIVLALDTEGVLDVDSSLRVSGAK
ncbi:MAG: BON domain-containing protein [Opitutaceae bacterium]